MSYELTIHKHFSGLELLLDELNNEVEIGVEYSFCDLNGDRQAAHGGEVWVNTFETADGDMYDCGVFLCIEAAKAAELPPELTGRSGELHIGRYVIPLYYGKTAAESWEAFAGGRWVLPDPIDELTIHIG